MKALKKYLVKYKLGKVAKNETRMLYDNTFYSEVSEAKEKISPKKPKKN